MLDEALASDYLRETHSFISAARRLQEAAVGGDAEALRRAADRLEGTVAGEQASRRFSPAARAEGGGSEVSDAAALTLIEAEVQKVNVLLEASQVLGEQGTATTAEALRDAIHRLDDSTRTLQTQVIGAQPAHMAFEDRSVTTRGSASLSDARTTLQGSVTNAVKTLVNDSEAVVLSAFNALSAIDYSKVVEALGNLGKTSRRLSGLRRFMQLAVEKLQQVIDQLTQFVGQPAIAAIRERLSQWWDEWREKKPVTRVLERVYGVEALQSRTSAVIAATDVKKDALDRAARELDGLAQRFAQTARTAGNVASGLVSAGSVLSLTALAGAPLTAAIAGSHLLVVAVIVLIGMDYADAESTVARVRGIPGILDGALVK